MSNKTVNTSEENKPAYQLSPKQWGVVTAVGTAGLVGGPIVAGTAAMGAAGGYYLSNVIGWNED